MTLVDNQICLPMGQIQVIIYPAIKSSMIEHYMVP